MSKKKLDWNETTEKQKQKARDRWRYVTWRENLKDLMVQLNQRPVYPEAQVKSDPLKVKQVMLLLAALLVALFAVYLMAKYLTPANIG